MRGAFNRHSDRLKARENEPVIEAPLGSCPKSFTADQRRAWKDITSQCGEGVLTQADTIAVELAAGLLARHRQAPLTSADLHQLTSLLGKFGMTPSERSKVSGKKSEKGSRWDNHA